MHNKKTIVIFNTSETREMSFAIKEYLAEDKSVLPIIIAEEELNSTLLNMADDKLLGEVSRALAVKHLYRRVSSGYGLDEIAKKTPEYNNDRKAHKKMRNIFKRYAPDLLLCLSQRCLKSAIAVKNFLHSEAKIIVYLSEYLADKSFVYKEVERYFVDSAFVKESLVSCGVPAEKITVNCWVVRKRYLNEVDDGIAKQEFGFPKEKPMVLIMLNGHINQKLRQLALRIADEKKYSVLVYCGYDRLQLKELLKTPSNNLVARNEGMDINLALSAADAVICRPRGEMVSVAKAKNRFTIIYAEEGELQKRAAANLSLEKAAYCQSEEDVKEILQSFFENREDYAEVKLNAEAPNESGKKLKELLIAMMS